MTTTLAVDYWLGGGLDTFAFHVTSFSLFFVQCVLLLVLYRRVMTRAPGRGQPLGRAARRVLVRPASGERRNRQLHHRALGDPLDARRRRRAGVVLRGGAARRYHLYLIPAALGVLGKETGAMFAPLLLVYVALFERGCSLRDL